MSAVIRLDGVAKSFGDLDVLAPADLEVDDGSVVTLLGPSGCGKTTLLRMVAGLERPSRGSITVGDTTPAGARARKVIGFVPQAPALLPWRTVEANARLLLDVNRGANPSPVPDHVDLLHAVGLGDFLHARPHELSGGMQQRVALVRAFALGSSILLMDEPFAALDEITRADMRHLLGRLCEQTGATVLFVTHSIAEAVFLSDRVVVLSARPGRIVGDVAIELRHPRLPEIEDDPAFFAHETRLRGLLHAGAGREGNRR
jgi:NitT/TauT family transport system ATP-binding protein